MLRRRGTLRRRARMVVSISVVVGRQGGRRGWQAVALNRKETIESVKFAVPLWKETTDEGGLAWDDSNNNAPSCGVASAPVLEEIADQPTGACAYHDGSAKACRRA